MKELTKKKITKSCSFPEIAEEIFVFLLYLFIIVFYYYYICMYIYNIFNKDNYELISVCTISIEELKSISQPNI